MSKGFMGFARRLTIQLGFENLSFNKTPGSIYRKKCVRK